MNIITAYKDIISDIEGLTHHSDELPVSYHEIIKKIKSLEEIILNNNEPVTAFQQYNAVFSYFLALSLTPEELQKSVFFTNFQEIDKYHRQYKNILSPAYMQYIDFDSKNINYFRLVNAESYNNLNLSVEQIKRLSHYISEISTNSSVEVIKNIDRNYSTNIFFFQCLFTDLAKTFPLSTSEVEMQSILGEQTLSSYINAHYQLDLDLGAALSNYCHYIKRQKSIKNFLPNLVKFRPYLRRDDFIAMREIELDTESEKAIFKENIKSSGVYKPYLQLVCNDYAEPKDFITACNYASDFEGEFADRYSYIMRHFPFEKCVKNYSIDFDNFIKLREDSAFLIIFFLKSYDVLTDTQKYKLASSIKLEKSSFFWDMNTYGSLKTSPNKEALWKTVFQTKYDDALVIFIQRMAESLVTEYVKHKSVRDVIVENLSLLNPVDNQLKSLLVTASLNFIEDNYFKDGTILYENLDTNKRQNILLPFFNNVCRNGVTTTFEKGRALECVEHLNKITDKKFANLVFESAYVEDKKSYYCMGDLIASKDIQSKEFDKIKKIVPVTKNFAFFSKADYTPYLTNTYSAKFVGGYLQLFSAPKLQEKPKSFDNLPLAFKIEHEKVAHTFEEALKLKDVVAEYEKKQINTLYTYLTESTDKYHRAFERLLVVEQKSSFLMSFKNINIPEEKERLTKEVLSQYELLTTELSKVVAGIDIVRENSRELREQGRFLQKGI